MSFELYDEKLLFVSGTPSLLKNNLFFEIYIFSADELKRQKELKMVEFMRKNGSKSGKRGRTRPKKLNPSKERKTKKVQVEIERKVDEAKKLEPVIFF